MAAPEQNLAGAGRLVESRRALDTRIIVFYFLIAASLLVLGGGLAYRQLIQTGQYDQSVRQQSERRIVMPGPRGNIYDRNHRLLVGNRPRFSAVLDLDQLQGEFRAEALRIRRNFRAAGESDVTVGQVEELARVSVVRRYFDQACAIAHRAQALDVKALKQRLQRNLLLPFTLLDNLTPEEFARILEGIQVRSPLQVAVTDVRSYPYGSLASHVLGYVRAVDEVDAGDLPGADLTTLRLRGTVGVDGLEKEFDARLQGRAGAAIFRVDPSGYRVNPPLNQQLPLPGQDLATSIDADLQLAAEQALGDDTGAAVVLEVRTGEVLAMASKPDYDLNALSPRASAATIADLNGRKAWSNLAIAGLFAPGSTFKTVVSVAGMRSGQLDPDKVLVDCDGEMRIGNRMFHCDNGLGHHGELTLIPAIAESCDIYFWTAGLAIGPERIAAEARRLGLGRPTGIDLPGESRAMIVPDAAWKRKNRHEPWTDGDTANFSIGQGFLRVTPLQMACWAASLARGETTTVPTLLHDPRRPAQHTASLGLTPEQRQALIKGMIACTDTTYPHDTAYLLSTIPAFRVPGVSIAGKTGTAQVTAQHTDIAWFICFAPADHPEIALALTVQGNVGNTDFASTQNSVPPAAAILQAYFRRHPAAAPAPPHGGA